MEIKVESITAYTPSPETSTETRSEPPFEWTEAPQSVPPKLVETLKQHNKELLQELMRVQATVENYN